jgi:hypothetical protein
MGFNKLYINKDRINDIVNEDGFEYLINFIRKHDSLIFEDKFSEKICSVINDVDDKLILIKLIETELYG